MAKITKAIIAAAGFGTRFLPATKVIPKELLPLIDKPIIQVLVEEAVASGISEVIIVTRPDVFLIQEHFSPKITIENHLKNQGKEDLIKKLKSLRKMAKFFFVEQDPSLPYGTGAPLLSAKNYLQKGEFFVLMFGDDLVKAKVPATKQLIEFWQKKRAVILGAQEVPLEQVSRYGILKLKKGSQSEVEDLVEKPKIEETPSRLASFGRFILNWEIIQILEDQLKNPQEGKEFYLTKAISCYAQKNPVFVAPVGGKWLTTGDPLNWLKATVEYALERKDLGKEFGEYLKEIYDRKSGAERRNSSAA